MTVIARGLDQPNGVAVCLSPPMVSTIVRMKPDGSILISDNRGNRLIRVSYRR